MLSLKRSVASVLLMGSLAMTTLAPATARADEGTAGTATTTLAEACAALADLIAFLEARPSGPLRDFLLAQARRLELRYCS